MANPRCYCVEGTTAVASSAVTQAALIASTAVRGEIFQIIIGTSGVPADNALLWKAQRFTAAGTGSAYTPHALDPADPAASCSGQVTNTIEPTYTSGILVWHAATNQRATLVFTCNPGANLKIPATSSNGIGIFNLNASYTGNADTCFYFSE